MHLLLIGLGSLFSIALLLCYAKLVGYRQISQISFYDYIVTLTMGNLAAQLATSLDNNFPEALVALVLYAVFALLSSEFARKSRWFRNFISGHPIVLMQNGQLFRDNFNAARITLDEFEAFLRSQGYFDVSQVNSAIMEHNGQVSILPMAAQKNVTTGDMNLSVPQESLIANVIMDGLVLERNLRTVNRSAEWLEKRLQSQGMRAQEVFLGTCDKDGKLTLYKKMIAPEESPL